MQSGAEATSEIGVLGRLASACRRPSRYVATVLKTPRGPVAIPSGRRRPATSRSLLPEANILVLRGIYPVSVETPDRVRRSELLSTTPFTSGPRAPSHSGSFSVLFLAAPMEMPGAARAEFGIDLIARRRRSSTTRADPSAGAAASSTTRRCSPPDALDQSRAVVSSRVTPSHTGVMQLATNRRGTRQHGYLDPQRSSSFRDALAERIVVLRSLKAAAGYASMTTRTRLAGVHSPSLLPSRRPVDASRSRHRDKAQRSPGPAERLTAPRARFDIPIQAASLERHRPETVGDAQELLAKFYLATSRASQLPRTEEASREYADVSVEIPQNVLRAPYGLGVRRGGWLPPSIAHRLRPCPAVFMLARGGTVHRRSTTSHRWRRPPSSARCLSAWLALILGHPSSPGWSDDSFLGPARRCDGVYGSSMRDLAPASRSESPSTYRASGSRFLVLPRAR